MCRKWSPLHSRSLGRQELPCSTFLMQEASHGLYSRWRYPAEDVLWQKITKASCSYLWFATVSSVLRISKLICKILQTHRHGLFCSFHQRWLNLLIWSIPLNHSHSSNKSFKIQHVILFEEFAQPFTTSYLNSPSVFLLSPQETKINCVRLANKGMSTLPLTLTVHLQ